MRTRGRMQDQEAQSAADSTKCWRWHMFMSPRNTVEKYSEIKNKMIRHKVLIELTCTRPEQTIKKKKIISLKVLKKAMRWHVT